MLRKKILIFSLLVPLYSYPQDMDQEVIPDVQIGSSGIDLAPEEEIATPTTTESTEVEPVVPAPSTPETPPEPAPESPPVEPSPTP